MATPAHPMPLQVELFGLDFTNLTVFGQTLGRNQSLFYLVWAFVAVVALLCKNLVRSRPGTRAPGRARPGRRGRGGRGQPVPHQGRRVRPVERDRDGRGCLLRDLDPVPRPRRALRSASTSRSSTSRSSSSEGSARSTAPIVGALLIGALPAVIDEFAGQLPFVSSSATESGISKPALEALLYAVLIIVFLVTEPRGLAGIWRRLRGYFLTWPLARETMRKVRGWRPCR